MVSTSERKARIDYREVLDEKTFKVYSQLRERRKVIAEEDVMPLYTIFTNAELAKIAALPELVPEKLVTIKGIGSGRLKKYGQRILKFNQSEQKNEESGRVN